jgi:hypothetical protein
MLCIYYRIARLMGVWPVLYLSSNLCIIHYQSGSFLKVQITGTALKFAHIDVACRITSRMWFWHLVRNGGTTFVE